MAIHQEEECAVAVAMAAEPTSGLDELVRLGGAKVLSRPVLLIGQATWNFPFNDGWD
jgi:hypothetical protein